MKLTEAFKSETDTRKVFSWLTRIGAAPKFGSRPIGWYQMHQCHCIDILREHGADQVRFARGMIEMKNGGWSGIMTPDQLFHLADSRCRK